MTASPFADSVRFTLAVWVILVASSDIVARVNPSKIVVANRIDTNPIHENAPASRQFPSLQNIDSFELEIL
jgi:hypothetical protein